jgi:hypothetical protein
MGRQKPHGKLLCPTQAPSHLSHQQRLDVRKAQLRCTRLIARPVMGHHQLRCPL